MPTTNSRTLSMLAFAGLLSLSIAGSADALPTSNEIELTPVYALYQTTSVDSTAAKYTEKYETKTPKEEAFALFGVQTNFSAAEKKTYWDAIHARSENTSINVFDLF